MRQIQHPGPAHGPRLVALSCTVKRADTVPPAGRSLLAALADARDEAGADSGVLALQGGRSAPLAWVLPHTAGTPEHAVCFSPRHDSPGPARLLGGVGSTVGACFDDGRVVQPHTTECLVEQGRIAPDARGQARAALEIAMVDHHGGQHRGRLADGANPVLVTFELVLQAD